MLAMPFDPLPETREALAMLGRDVDEDFTAQLVHRAGLVEEVVPNLVGMSLAAVSEGFTFTVVATDDRVALLDAIQYAFGGPCVDAALTDATLLSGDSEDGLLDEQRWAQFARVSAAHGVMSTLSLPIHDHGHVVGGVNLYAATPNAFGGREEQVAQILGAWAPGAVHNADLSFSTRATARQAPQALADRATMDQATGIVVAAHAVDQGRARQIISQAARLAGQEEIDVARALIRSYGLGQDDTR